ncbi:MAG: aminoglycoside phosphotransferase family protein [Patescibacteria group bacterium]
MPKQQFSFEYLAEIAAKFLGLWPESAERYGKGAINDSFRVVVGNKSYLLQRVNDQYFPEPLKLLENFSAIASCRGQALGLSAIGLKNGNVLWYRDESGAYWRLYDFFDHSYSCQSIENIYQAYEIAKAYGQYLALLSKLPLEALNVVVPDFHNTLWRYQQLILARQQDRFSRVADCAKEIEFIKSRLEEIAEFSALVDSGKIPSRLTHNDTGIDNVLLDKSTGAAVAVIDLDTTMPGYSLWDFGDMFRSALGVEFDERPGPIECFSALLSGYLAGTGQLLLPEEVENFALAGRIISLELGIRYLTDYLSGDAVFCYSNGASLLRARKSLLRYKIMSHHADQFRVAVDKAIAVYCA